jgi:hypothetical protein
MTIFTPSVEVLTDAMDAATRASRERYLQWFPSETEEDWEADGDGFTFRLNAAVNTYGFDAGRAKLLSAPHSDGQSGVYAWVASRLDDGLLVLNNYHDIVNSETIADAVRESCPSLEVRVLPDFSVLAGPLEDILNAPRKLFLESAKRRALGDEFDAIMRASYGTS